MIIKHNLSAMNTRRQLNLTGNQNAKVTEKLSSGYKINKAADDAAGLAMSEKMRRQIRGLNQGIANTQDGVSLNQVADGALAEVHKMLHRITELSVKAANGTNSPQDRQAIQHEITEILAEIDRIGDTTKFNELHIFKGTDVPVLNGDGTPAIPGRIPVKDLQLVDLELRIAETAKDTNLENVPLQSDMTQLIDHYYAKPVWIQSGCDAGDGIWLELGEMNCKVLGIEGLDVTTMDGACDAIDQVGETLGYISAFRSRLGAQQNRLEHTIANESNVVENTSAAESLIRDTDMADRMVQHSLNNVLLQSGQAMLAQANKGMQGVLQMLQ